MTKLEMINIKLRKDIKNNNELIAILIEEKMKNNKEMFKITKKISELELKIKKIESDKLEEKVTEVYENFFLSEL